MDMAVMGERIKAARIQKKLTLEKLSEKIGISRNFLWEIEAGRKAPAIQTLYSIGKELGISIDYLFCLSPKAQILDNEEIEMSDKINHIIKNLDLHERHMLYALLDTYCENK